MQHEEGADFTFPLPMFLGGNDDWLVWSPRFGAYAELGGWTAVFEVAETQTAAIYGPSLDAIRLEKNHSCCLVDEDRAKLSALFISRLEELERLGGFYTQNTQDPLEHV